jgi:hypothetical protein
MRPIWMSQMTNEDKSVLYDKYLRQIYTLQNENSRIKSENILNISAEQQMVINENNMKISVLETKVKNLF